MNYHQRIEAVRSEVTKSGAAAFLVTRSENVRYLSGFSGSSGYVLVFSEGCVLFTDGRYAGRAAGEISLTCLPISLQVTSREDPFEQLRRATADFGTLALEADHVTLSVRKLLESQLPHLRLIPAESMVEGIRITKDTGELARLRASAAIADAALTDLHRRLPLGLTEEDVADFVNRRVVELGAEGPSFNAIVASGPNSAIPHARPSKRLIERGDPVIVDFGATVDGYHSDMTRTIWFGDLRRDVVPLYEAVLASNLAGVQAARAGATHEHVDAVCKEVLGGAGFGTAVVHPSGHNLGLSVHELPFLSPGSRRELESSQVITVEPGAYVPGLAGVRIEDMVIVGDVCSEVITHSPKLEPRAS